MSDRHPKWTPVEPGHVIPVGQPYRVEYHSGGANETAGRHTVDWTVGKGNYRHFVDSSWKPPLDLPTTPTWGIVIFTDRSPSIPREWRLSDGRFRDRRRMYALIPETVLDFIPFTPEQVARIEAAR